MSPSAGFAATALTQANFHPAMDEKNAVPTGALSVILGRIRLSATGVVSASNKALLSKFRRRRRDGG
jgi:hypothetical protein